MTYYVKPQNYWSGSWAATPADSIDNPNLPMTAFQYATALNAGSLSGDKHVIFDGTNGPFDARDADDWPDCSLADSSVPMAATGSGNRPTAAGNLGKTMIFGNDSDNTNGGSSYGDGWHFEGRGPRPNVNMSAINDASPDTDRQAFALLFQGYDQLIHGFHVKPARRCPVLTGRVTKALGNSGSKGYVDEASHENGMIWVRGGWGTKMFDCSGADGLFSYLGLLFEFRTMDPGGSNYTYNQNKIIEIFNCDFGDAAANMISPGSGMTGPNASIWLPFGSVILVHNNTFRDCYWQGPAGINAAKFHGNLLGCYSNAMNGARILVFNNTFFGDCQDALVGLGANVDFFDNDIYDISPNDDPLVSVNTFNGVPGSTTYSGYAAGWDVTTMAAKGNGIKHGLGEGYTGTTGAAWGLRGTDRADVYKLDDTRPRIYRNRIRNIVGIGLTNNGGPGMFAFANEIDAVRGSAFRAIVRTGSGGKTYSWLANNYLKSPNISGVGTSSLGVEAYNAVMAYNNIIEGQYRSAWVSGTQAELYGSNNRVYGAAVGGGGTISWTNTYTGAVPDYVVGKGAVKGGNCDALGTALAMTGAKMPHATKFAMGRRYWKMGALPLGPYQP